jgi:hypothetical protein
MAIDYLLSVACEPQRELGVDRLVALNRTRILARSALAHMRAEGDQREPAEIHIQLTTHTPASRQASQSPWGAPDGESGRGVTLADLFAEASPLDAVTEHCKVCPAHLSRELACHRRIRYPIPEHVEAWLMGRLPESLACTAGALLVRSIGEFGWDGAPTAKLRAAGTTYFESRAPYGVRWAAPDGSSIELSSDQLFQMMFMVGHVTPAHALMIALFCGVIPHDTPIRDLTDEASQARALAAASVASEADADIEQLAAFLRMLAVAARRGATILIDS